MFSTPGGGRRKCCCCWRGVGVLLILHTFCSSDFASYTLLSTGRTRGVLALRLAKAWSYGILLGQTTWGVFKELGVLRVLVEEGG